MTAALAADTLIFTDAVAAFLHGFPAKGKALPVRRKLTQVKVLPYPFINLEYLQCLPALLRGIDLFHIGVLYKNLIQEPFSDIPHRTPHRDRHRRKGVTTFHTGKRHKGVLHQPRIKRLAAGGQEV